MKIKLNISKKQFAPIYFPLLEDYTHRVELYMGSAGSGKSYFVSQKILYRCLKEPIKVLVCRRYGSTIRNSVFSLFKSLLAKWKLKPPIVDVRESDFNIKFFNGSEIIFMGLDDEEKLLSLDNISTVFVEEIFEISEDIFTQLNLRMRGKAKNQQIIGCFNPISQSSWLYNYCVENPPEDLQFIRTTYKDNPFLSQEYIDSIEALRERNPQKFRIYGLGEWGVNTDALVYKDWEVKEFNPLELAASGLEHRVGLDVGFVDATAIVDTLYDAAARTIYIFNEFYATGQQLDQIVAAMDKMNLRRVKIQCDSADQRAIAFFRNKGFNAVPCVKGRDSVQMGIAFLQNNHIVIHPNCKNYIKEIEQYVYLKDKKTGKLTEDTEHSFSHAQDAARYAYSDLYTQNRVKSFDKSILGL